MEDVREFVAKINKKNKKHSGNKFRFSWVRRKRK